MVVGRLSTFCALLALSALADSAAGSREVASALSALEAHDLPPLPFYYDLYTFRGAANKTAVIAAFAVPVKSLAQEQADDRIRYRFDVTLVLADTALRRVIRRDDSVFVDLPRALSDDHLLYTHSQVESSTSNATVQRVIMIDATTPGVGQMYSHAYPVPDYSGTDLMLSDIALGQPDAEAGWKRGDVALALLPTSQFPSSAFDVYYEIYNLPKGHTFITEVIVERADDSGIRWLSDRRPVHVRFNGVSAAHTDATLNELRRVETSLQNGRHRITVNITDETTQQTATKSRVFHVRGWKRGATLVPAHPWVDRLQDE